MRRLLFVLFAILIPITLLAQTAPAPAGKHPFTFEEMMKLKRIGDFAVSPDGRWVTFTATDVSLEKNTRTPHLWIVPVAGGEGRRLTPEDGPAVDRLRFAPDGKRVLFTTSTKGGASQIFVQQFDPATGTLVGEPQQVTNISTEADGAIWSPDGRQILFVSSVYPDCDVSRNPDACNKARDEESSKSKVKAQIFTHLLYRHWNAYGSGKRSHLFLVDANCDGSAANAACAGRDLTPGDYDVPPFSLGGQDEYQFSPDGREIAYTSNHDPVEATSTNADVFILSLTDPNAKPVNLTADNHGYDGTPMYSPDGKWLAIRSQFKAGYESDKFRLRLIDRKKELATRLSACEVTDKQTGAKGRCPETQYITNLTEDFDRWVGSVAWAPDSQRLFFTAEDAGMSPVYEIGTGGFPGLPLKGVGQTDMPRPVVEGHVGDLLVTSDGQTLVFSQDTVRGPAGLYKFDLPAWDPLRGSGVSQGWQETHRQQRPAPLTHMNDAVLSQVQMQPVEPFWFTGANKDKVEGFILKPPDFDPNKKYPVKFLVHGGPQGQWGDDWSYRWNPNLFAADGYVIVMINFHGSTGYGQKFIDAINGNWGGAPFEDLMLGLDYAEKTYPFIDKDRECALGASYGGYMANWLLGHTTRFKCIVSHDGMFNSESAWGTTEELWFNEWEYKGTPWTSREVYRKWSPHLSADKFKTPTLVVHGQLDYRLDVSEGFQLFTTLQRMGVPSKMLYFPDEGHWVLKPQNSQLWWKTVTEWCDQWVKK